MFEFVPYLSFLTSGIGLFFIFYLLVRFGHIGKIYGLVFVIFALVYLEFYIYALTSKHIYKMLFILRTPNILRAFLPISLFFTYKACCIRIARFGVFNICIGFFRWGF